MMARREPQPPRWAQRLLSWYCRPELAEDLEGDLNEMFDRNVRERGPFRAKVIYCLDVIKFCRPYTIRRPNVLTLIPNMIMLGSYFKSATRSIARSKLFSAINIVGLSVGMSVGLLLIAMLTDILSYDRFHENRDRIYRVTSQFQRQGDLISGHMATTSLLAGKEIKESLAGIEDVAVIHRGFMGDITYGEKVVPFGGLMADESFFNVFSFKLLHGNPATALKEPFSIVLTETFARKLFGEENAVGKTVLVWGRDFSVTGVVQDPPKFSHMRFDVLGSLSTRTITEKDNPYEMLWENIWNAYAYVLLPPNSSPESLQQRLDEICRRKANAVASGYVQLGLQPMENIVIGQNLGNQIGPYMGSTVVWVFSAMTLVVILSACFNYTNLSTARSFRRLKEVGIRKTIGAVKGNLLVQFVTESVVIALLALIFAVGIFVIIRPHFISMEYSLQEMLVMDLSPQLIGLFILFALLVGVAAGFFPALFFSRLSAVSLFKGGSGRPSFRGITARKILVVFQFVISIMFISGTVVIYDQYKHFLSYDLGYNTENILNIRLGDNKADALKNELSKLPEVAGQSQSQLVMSVGNYFYTFMKNPSDPNDSAQVYYNRVDENFLPLHDFKLIAGRNFNPKSPEDSTEREVIVSSSVLRRFNLGADDPSKAIGAVVNIDHTDLQIVGVVEDFHYGRVNNATNKEVVFRQLMPEEAKYLNVKFVTNDLRRAYEKVEQIWSGLDSNHPLQAKFLDDQLEESFRGFSASVKAGGFIAVLVVCIASLGLLGMVIYTSEIRLREMSIRKVFGASEVGILYRLARGFMLLLGVSIAIAIPLTFLFFDRILLPGVANHAPLTWFEMVSGAVVILTLAALMILSQTLKVARSKPAEVLRTE
ncbi:MAG TPA: ABC transporter permease [Cyclobacteriaceae bacterium]|jgi:ABC-type antimicrobial peptide transport system permease subunit